LALAKAVFFLVDCSFLFFPLKFFFFPVYGKAFPADTGGAIVGNKIDLVMDSYGEAMDFGRQDVTVYVLD